MKKFFGDNVLLNSDSACLLYNEVKDLPIIDYHCHLDQTKIANDYEFGDIGEVWLSGDHYKWRAMRLCGVDEKYITGNASYKDKFMAYAAIMPKLIGNPLYYWTHFELKQVFGIDKPLNADTAEEIYAAANKALKDISVCKLLKKFNVEYVATTDDPLDSLQHHGKYGSVKVCPTFRPDKLCSFDKDYIDRLGIITGCNVSNLNGFKAAVCARLDYFVSKGCRIADHGFAEFPKFFASDEDAEELYAGRALLTSGGKEALFGWILKFLMREYKKRGIVMQLHFAVTRNVNTHLFKTTGADSGLDIMSKEADTGNLISLLDSLTDDERPAIILYTLNPNTIPALATLSGAFRNVYIGAAWWFNDTLSGISKNLDYVSEYAVLGTNLGMLTDSRSFTSYVRFDFFRRILCSFVGDKVEKGEYGLDDAKQLVKDISYNNIKKLLNIR